VVARLPSSAPPRFNRAAALAALGRLDEARTDLRTLIALEPPGSEYANAARDALAALGAP